MKGLPWTWIIAGLRRYAVAVLLMFSALVNVGGYLVHGDAAVPQVPPGGYVVQKQPVRLAWFRGDWPDALELQLTTREQGFDKPILSETVRGNAVRLPELKPGKTYLWRLVRPESGRVSTCISFSTAKYMVRYQ
ncbi:MAG: hypothetical protein GXP49_16720 [Deltaproteobacteria bacterium]|nr:hypothetical protein [Deltaproteobacteria bacterium]